MFITAGSCSTNTCRDWPWHRVGAGVDWKFTWQKSLTVKNWCSLFYYYSNVCKGRRKRQGTCESEFVIEEDNNKDATTCVITNYINTPIKDSCDYFFCTAYSENEVKAAALSSVLAQITLTDTLYLLTAGYKKRIWNINELNNMIEKTLRDPY